MEKTPNSITPKKPSESPTAGKKPAALSPNPWSGSPKTTGGPPVEEKVEPAVETKPTEGKTRTSAVNNLLNGPGNASSNVRKLLEGSFVDTGKTAADYAQTLYGNIMDTGYRSYPFSPCQMIFNINRTAHTSQFMVVSGVTYGFPDMSLRGSAYSMFFPSNGVVQNPFPGMPTGVSPFLGRGLMPTTMDMSSVSPPTPSNPGTYFNLLVNPINGYTEWCDLHKLMLGGYILPESLIFRYKHFKDLVTAGLTDILSDVDKNDAAVIDKIIKMAKFINDFRLDVFQTAMSTIADRYVEYHTQRLSLAAPQASNTYKTDRSQLQYFIDSAIATIKYLATQEPIGLKPTHDYSEYDL